MFESPTTSRGRRPFRHFLLWLLLLPAIAFFAAFALVRSPLYLRFMPSQWGQRLDYAFHIGRQNADVLIFGDSSAFIGVDPRQINAELGIKSLVIPATIGSLPITGQIALDRYLATNRPPRLMVIFLPPWNLDYIRSPNIHMFEGEELLFRYGTLRELASFAGHHPIESFLFPFRLYSTFDPEGLRHPTKMQEARSVANALGHFSDTEPFPVQASPCRVRPEYLEQQGEQTAQDLLKTFRSRFPTMVYVAPVPNCRNVGPFLHAYPDLQAGAPVVLPAYDFLSDTSYAHIEPREVPETTRLFTKVLEQHLQQLAR